MPLLTEKYRPQTTEDMIGFKQTFAIDEDMPHLLLHGSAGTGKTTLAKIIIKMLGADSLILNASSDRGIDIVRQKVIDFASTQSTTGAIKIVFLDEADHLTNDAQTALRNTMEKYCRNTRFIFTANYVSKIIDPIQSRCILVKFDNIPKDAILNRLEYICKNENIPYEIDALKQIIEYTGNDIRSAINKIEEYKDGVMLSKLRTETKIAEIVFDYIKKKDFITARQYILDNPIIEEQLLRDLYEVIMASSESLEYKKFAICNIAESYKWLGSVAWRGILIEDLLIKLMK